jgi:hypothetical protein
MQHLGGRLELFVLQQPVDQFLSRIFKLLFLGLRRIARQQHPRLDLDKRRGHHQKVGRDRNVEALHQPDVPQVLVGDLRDRDVEDIRLLLTDQKEQQIERARKFAHLDLQLVTRPGEDLGRLFMKVECKLFERFLLHQRWVIIRGFGGNALLGHAFSASSASSA